MSRLISVAVPVPLVGALTYSVPPGVEPVVGARVLVPLGSRLVTGCVIDVDVTPHAAEGAGVEIRPVVELLDEDAFLPEPVVRLVRWVADYYLCGIGEAMAAALPPFSWIESEPAYRRTGGPRALLPDPVRAGILRALDHGATVARSTLLARVTAATGAARDEVERALRALQREGTIDTVRTLRGRASGFRTVQVVSLTPAGLEAETRPGVTDRQRRCLRLLREQPEGLPRATLAREGISRAVVDSLTRRGLVARAEVVRERDPFEAMAGLVGEVREAARAGVALTGEQEDALSRLRGLAAPGQFGVAVLHGVTGSGKTEVYRRLAQEVVATGRRVLVLVPEIALTPAVAATFRHSFGTRVAIQHSALPEGERHDQWHRIRRGQIDVVVGTRSAVFAPIGDVGLVIVDEEHDPSYKQEEAPRYHGRDVAIVRARQAGALVVLGSATPALETWHNAVTGRYVLVPMRRRVRDRPLARVSLVDMREEYAASGPEVVLSRRLVEAIAVRLARKEQAMLLLNRRGFASAVFCRACGATLDCPNCSVSLTFHRRARQARCHYCDHRAAVPPRCPACAGELLEYRGVGTERVEAEVRALFPAARVARVDRDTVRRRGEIARVLERFGRREIDVLVGTQMIAKGHDFPDVTLVGVISADVGLGQADFRAGERTFQLLTQVAGRAGRGDVPGEALVQTLFPDHYSIVLATAQDYETFVTRELQYRRAMLYPPAGALVNLIARGPSLVEAMGLARSLAEALRRHAAGESLRVVGPAPAPLNRLRGDYRAQVFVKGRDRRAMRAAVQEALDRHAADRRHITVDVDPLNVL